MIGRLTFFEESSNNHNVGKEVGGQAVLGRQSAYATPWLTERHGYDPTCQEEITTRFPQLRGVPKTPKPV